MTKTVTIAAVCLLMTTAAAVADGLEIVGSVVRQTANGAYAQSLRGGGQQEIRVNEITGNGAIRGENVHQYLDANVVQYLVGDGPQRTYLNRLIVGDGAK